MRRTMTLLAAAGALALGGAAHAQLIAHGTPTAGGGQLSGAINSPLSPDSSAPTTTGEATRIGHDSDEAKGDAATDASGSAGATASDASRTGQDTAATAGAKTKGARASVSDKTGVSARQGASVSDQTGAGVKAGDTDVGAGANLSGH